jgi:hypothetical protein
LPGPHHARDVTFSAGVQGHVRGRILRICARTDALVVQRHYVGDDSADRTGARYLKSDALATF